MTEGAGPMGRYTKFTDEQLLQEDARLADEKRAITGQQRQLAAEMDLRRALVLMNTESRRIILLQLGGEIAPAGETATAVEEG